MGGGEKLWYDDIYMLYKGEKWIRINETMEVNSLKEKYRRILQDAYSFTPYISGEISPGVRTNTIYGMKS